jgi:hypothetical protein
MVLKNAKRFLIHLLSAEGAKPSRLLLSSRLAHWAFLLNAKKQRLADVFLLGKEKELALIESGYGLVRCPQLYFNTFLINCT